MSNQPANPPDDRTAPSSPDEALVERLLSETPAAGVHSDADANALAATVAALALSVPPSAAVAGDPVRASLLARASADARQRASAQPARQNASRTDTANVPSSTARTHAVRWIAASLTTLAAAASLLLVLRIQSDRVALQNTVDTLEIAQRVNQQQLDSLTLALRERDAQLASVTGPDVAVVELASTGALPPAGRMFWDRATARWTFVANNMPNLEAGRTYALWLLTADERILAGYFAPDARGVAVVRATYELPRTALSAVAVTEEPDTGVEQPTGPIVLVGSAGSAP